MADEDSSDFTFCKVDSAENDDQLESPKAIPVASMTLEDEGGDSVDMSKTRKKIQDDRETNNLIKDGRFNSLSSSINSVSLQDSNIKEPVIPKSSGESLLSNASSQTKPLKKPAARAKVPFEKGYSQMDWLKLTRTHPDLAGIKGQSNRRLISLEEVKQHKTGDCIWTVLKGRVYNIAPYMKFHPGGVDMLTKAAGKNCTALFSILLSSSWRSASSDSLIPMNRSVPLSQHSIFSCLHSSCCLDQPALGSGQPLPGRCPCRWSCSAPASTMSCSPSRSRPTFNLFVLSVC